MSDNHTHGASVGSTTSASRDQNPEGKADVSGGTSQRKSATSDPSSVEDGHDSSSKVVLQPANDVFLPVPDQHIDSHGGESTTDAGTSTSFLVFCFGFDFDLSACVCACVCGFSMMGSRIKS